MARIILVTIGSLGDLHPFIAVALALKSLGHNPIMAVPAYHVEKCHTAGLEVHAVFPSYDTLAQEIGDNAETITRNVMKSPDYLVRQIMLRSLKDSAAKIDALAVGADLIITSMFALAGPMIAQKRNIPIVPLLLQPLAILSASSPSIMPDLPLFVRGSPRVVGQAWNRLVITLMRKEMLRRFGKPMNVVRQSYGLGPAKAAPMFELEGSIPLQIATYDPLFAPLPSDAPHNILLTGFPSFDSSTGEADNLPLHLEQFLDNGPPPIVFTLGSFAVNAPGDFYSDSLAAARALEYRSVLLIGADGTPPKNLGPDVCVVDYAPHSKLFPRASCVVHHGGIGTTGQALMAGKPQLIVPFMGDQPDNASRIVALGVGLHLPAKGYTPERAKTRLSALLSDKAMLDQARMLAGQMIQDGAMRAANAICDVLKMS
jgi:rhamnosyltransferase subunit B